MVGLFIQLVLEVEHEEFGHVQIKTEIHEIDTPSPKVTIYATPLDQIQRFYCTFWKL